MRDRASDRRLMRYLHGELSAAEVRQLRAELARDPALQARLAELHRIWQGLQAGPATPAPFGFVPKLQRLADERRVAASSSVLGWGAAPPWARALAGAALLAGIGLGVGLGRLPQPPSGEAPVVSAPPAAPMAPGVGAGTEPGGREGTGAATGAAPQAGRPPAQAPTDAQAQTEPQPQAQSHGQSAAGSRQAEAVPPGPEPGGSSTADAADADAAPFTGGSTLAEDYWEALAGTSGESADAGAGESGARW